MSSIEIQTRDFGGLLVIRITVPYFAMEINPDLIHAADQLFFKLRTELQKRKVRYSIIRYESGLLKGSKEINYEITFDKPDDWEWLQDQKLLPGGME